MSFFVGDDNGSIKRLMTSKLEGILKISAGEDLAEGPKGKQRAVQAMVVDAEQKLASLLKNQIIVLDNGLIA